MLRLWCQCLFPIGLSPVACRLLPNHLHRQPGWVHRGLLVRASCIFRFRNMTAAARNGSAAQQCMQQLAQSGVGYVGSKRRGLCGPKAVWAMWAQSCMGYVGPKRRGLCGPLFWGGLCGSSFLRRMLQCKPSFYSQLSKALLSVACLMPGAVIEGALREVPRCGSGLREVHA